MKNEVTDHLLYPEMPEYMWAKDLDRVAKNSKWVKQDYSREPITSDNLPKVPINMALAVLTETLSYPEVLRVQEPEYDDPKRAGHFMMWYSEYIRHKYGNNNCKMRGPDFVLNGFLPKIVNGEHSGVDDDKLIQDLLKEFWVGEDDGKQYARPPAS